MPANNSPTNRAIRRGAALKRFSIDPSRATDAEYLKRKEVEKTSLEKARRE